ncbi:hypothetical protein GJ496_008533 [Pomphorhynchus laevis]|nr:hypothetical protein GJ496_008533 [Pomphorhynchus laevis]
MCGIVNIGGSNNSTMSVAIIGGSKRSMETNIPATDKKVEMNFVIKKITGAWTCSICIKLSPNRVTWFSIGFLCHK